MIYLNRQPWLPPETQTTNGTMVAYVALAVGSVFTASPRSNTNPTYVQHIQEGGVLVQADVLALMHGRSRMTIDPRIPATPGHSMSGFH